MLNGKKLSALAEAAQHDDWLTVGLVYLGLAGERPNPEYNSELARLAGCLRRRDADRLARLVETLSDGAKQQRSGPAFD